MSTWAVILAAGLGTRMRSRLAKVLHPVLGRPMVGWVVAACREAGVDGVLVVVHHQEQAVRAALEGTGARFVRQAAPRGTGDAVRAAVDALPDDARAVVVPGDAPLVRAETLRDLLAEAEGPVTLLTARVADPAAYGRVVRDAEGRPLGVVEAAEASSEQLAIDEINTGVYVFDVGWLRRVLPSLAPHPPKGEIYLTDTVALAKGAAGARLHPDPDELMGVNDRWTLSRAAAVLRERILRRHALAGVSFDDPATTEVEPGVELARDVSVGRGVVLRGATRVGEGSRIGPYCVIEDSEIGSGVDVRSHSVIEGAQVAAGARVGPFARLRPGADLGEEVHVGNFVEVKKSRLDRGAKANHLSYLGDAHVGADANVGAGTITANYDGFAKHRTVIGRGASVGCNSVLVAPVTLGDRAVTGAGAVVVRDVPEDAIVTSTARQEVREGAAPAYRERARRRARGEGRDR